MCGFIAQLVEHRTGIAEVTGSNPVEALIFFRFLLSNCLNWKIYYDDHSSLSYLLLLAPKTLLKKLVDDNTILHQINLIFIFNQTQDKIGIPWLDSYPIRQQAAEERTDTDHRS